MLDGRERKEEKRHRGVGSSSSRCVWSLGGGSDVHGSACEGEEEMPGTQGKESGGTGIMCCFNMLFCTVY